MMPSRDRNKGVIKKEIILKEVFNHTLNELEIMNLLDSIRKGDFKKLVRAHDSIHEFIYLPSISLPSGRNMTWHRKSAFLTYQFDVFYAAHRSLLEALAGYYNAGYTLLRNTLELLLKGAFWECLAHKKFRNSAETLKKSRSKVYGKKRSLIDWFNDMFKLHHEIEDEFEEISVAIFDKVSPIFEDKELSARANACLVLLLLKYLALTYVSPANVCMHSLLILP